MKKDFDTLKKEIFSTFDFEKVRKVMIALKWKWAFSITEDQIPTIGEIVIRAENLLIDAYERKERVASGGLIADYEADFDHLTLMFVVEEAESNDND